MMRPNKRKLASRSITDFFKRDQEDHLESDTAQHVQAGHVVLQSKRVSDRASGSTESESSGNGCLSGGGEGREGAGTSSTSGMAGTGGTRGTTASPRGAQIDQTATGATYGGTRGTTASPRGANTDQTATGSTYGGTRGATAAPRGTLLDQTATGSTPGGTRGTTAAPRGTLLDQTATGSTPGGTRGTKTSARGASTDQAAPVSTHTASKTDNVLEATKAVGKPEGARGTIASKTAKVLKAIKAVGQLEQQGLPFSTTDVRTSCPPARHHVLDSDSWVEEGGLPPPLKPNPKQFDALWACHPPERGVVIIFGKKIPTPRWQQPYLRPYKFSGIIHAGLPLPSEFGPYLDWGNSLSCVQAFGGFNGLLVNWYQVGNKGGNDYMGAHLDDENELDGNDYMGAHSDDEKELVVGAPILSISLGQERIFRVSSKPQTPKLSQDFVMPGSSYIIMGGPKMQAQYKHAVPKVNGAKGKGLGRRINITFRVFKS
eukprot:gene10697-12393_t